MTSQLTPSITTPVRESIAPPRAGRRSWAALAVLMLPVVLVSVDNTVLGLALPAIAADLHPTAAAQLWMMDVYPLVLAALLLVMGVIGDRVGRRRMLLIGATGFAVISAATAFAPTAGLLIAGRAAMAVFGAMLMPATLALIRSTFARADERRIAIATWTATFGAGAALGPLVGGLLLSVFGWGSVFLMAVPVLVPLLVLAPVLVTESRDPNPGRIDPASVLLSVLTLGPVVLAIKEVAVHGVTLLTFGLFVGGLVVGAVFVQRQRMLITDPVRQPMLDVDLFRLPGFRYSVVLNLLSLMAMVGFLFVVSQHLQLVMGLTPLATALVLLPGGLVSMVAGFGAVRLVRRVPVRVAITGALLVSATGYGLVALDGAGTSAVVIGTAFVLLGVGIGVAETLSNDLVISSAPPARAGAASAVSETAYEIGAVLGTTVLGGIITMAYRTQIAVPVGVGPIASEVSRGSLAGALDEAATLADTVGPLLAEQARAAFEAGVGLTTGLGALLMVLAAALAFRGLRPR